MTVIAWVIFPYIALTLFVAGNIWRYRFDKFGWTTRSSQLYDKKLLRAASPLFHLGILMVFGGHLMGLLIPSTWTAAVGITQHAYHLVATIAGTFAGTITIIGLVLLLVRRFTLGPVLKATTRGDKFMYLLLSLPIGLGMAATVANQILGGSHGYDYRQTISPWLRSLFYFQPDVQLMADVPITFKLHIVAAFLLMAIWPWTRLVHALTPPLGYVTRPDIRYRSRVPEPRTAKAPRGWEGVPYRGGRDTKISGDD